MSVTIVTRWSTPDMATAKNVLRRAQAIQMKHGAQTFRASQVYTGEFTGQLVVAAAFADLAAWAGAQPKITEEMQPLFAEVAKSGGVMHERAVLMGIDF
jgi:hypothetical protein